MGKNILIILGALALMLMGAWGAHAASYTFYTSGNSDGYVDEKGKWNLTSNILEADYKSQNENSIRSFLEYDISSIPANEVVDSATLILYVTKDPKLPSGGTYTAHFYHYPGANTFTGNVQTDGNWTDTTQSVGQAATPAKNTTISFDVTSYLQTDHTTYQNTWSAFKGDYVTNSGGETQLEWQSGDNTTNQPRLVIETHVIPTPGTLLLLGSGLAGLGLLRFRRKRL